MLRLTLPGGGLTSLQLKAVAQIASELELEFSFLTPGRSLDLSGISAGPIAGLIPRLAEAGISAAEIPAGCPGLDAASAVDPDGVGVREQPEPGLFTIGVPVLAGRFSVNQMRKAADVAERHADGKLQLTSRQNLLFLNVPKDKVLQVMEGLESVDLKVAASIYRRGLTACAEGSEERARGLVEHLEKQVPLKEPVGIHFSAGACNCEQVLAAEIGLRATQIQVEDRMIDAYQLAVDGRPVSVPALPAGMAKVRLENLLVRWKRDRAPGESFREFSRRTGDEEIARLLSEEAAHPAA